MNKKELVAALAEHAEVSEAEAGKVLDALLCVATKELKAGGEIALTGFGTLKTTAKAARTARNPRTGEEVRIAACKAPVFKAGKGLKEAVNE